MTTPSNLYGKPMPHAPEAEVVLLGNLLNHPTMAMPILRREQVGPAKFYDERHAAIFLAIIEAHRQDGDTLPVQVASRLRDANRLDEVGGESYLERLMATTPGKTAVEWAAKKVAECARLRRVVDAADKITHSILNRGGTEDANDLCGRAVELIADAGRVESATRDIRLADAERQVLDQLVRREASMLPVGIGGMDQQLGGIPAASCLCVVNGGTSVGKSTLCLAMLDGLARIHGRWVRVFSYEQPSKRVAATMLSAAAGVPVHERWNRGELPSDDEWERLRKAHAEHESLNFEIVEQNLNASAIFAQCVEYREKFGPKGVVLVDYLQNLPPMHRDDVQSIAESMRWLQRIARELDLLVIVVSQVNRETLKANQPPKITDALGGIAIESKVDMIMAIHRPHFMEARPESDSDVDRASWQARQRITEIHIVKDKYGARGMAELNFDMRLLRFT